MTVNLITYDVSEKSQSSIIKVKGLSTNKRLDQSDIWMQPQEGNMIFPHYLHCLEIGFFTK